MQNVPKKKFWLCLLTVFIADNKTLWCFGIQNTSNCLHYAEHDYTCVNVMHIANPSNSNSISIKVAICHIIGSLEFYYYYVFPKFPIFQLSLIWGTCRNTKYKHILCKTTVNQMEHKWLRCTISLTASINTWWSIFQW